MSESLVLYVGLGVLFVSIAGGVGAALTIAADRAEVRKTLSRLEGYEIENIREQEMLAPLFERLFAPLISKSEGFFGRFTPQGYSDSVARKLVIAGSPEGLDPDRFMALKALGLLSIILWVPFVIVFLNETLGLAFGGFFSVVMILTLTGVTYYLPDLTINRRIAERQEAIAIRLPDILDLLVISVEAGLGFDQAVDRTATAVPGPLSDEFMRMLQETRVGASRADALRAMDERTDVPEFRSFILAMLQADTFGVSIGRVLRSQAEEMRIRRRLRGQEKAQKAPVKMLFPLIFCIFPSIFVVILGPAAIDMSKNL